MAEPGKTLGWLGWLAVTVVPPSVVAGAGLDWVRDNKILAALLLVGYEGVLAVFAFAREVATELVRRWRNRLIDRLDQTLGRRFGRFDRRYREFVLGALRFVDLKGLATVGPYTPQLDEVFVDVSLAPRSPHQVAADPLADVPAEVTERHALRDFLDGPQPRVLAVVGAAGSGKTTLLRHTARRVCRTVGRRRRTVPILLLLRDHAARIVAEPGVALPELLRGTLGRYQADEPPGWFEHKLRDGACVILLDGLDEVAHRADRRAVADWVEHQIEQYPGNDYVITSRPHGYRAAEIGGATVLQVRSFTGEQVSRFVHGWYRSVERHRTGVDAEEVETHAATAADDLLDRLRDAPGLFELTVNPLLLTMIANVHHYRSALPGSRAELYGEICEVMLWRRHGAKKLPVELGGDQKELLLRRLAFTMMERRVRDLPAAEVLAAIKPALRRVSKQVTAEEFLADVGSNGLLVERENGLFSFAHHTFQEYLAAAHIQDKGLTGALAASVDDGWWRETTLLYAARGDADPLIKACLESDTVTALALAFDCAQYAREVDPGLRERLDELLESSYDADTDPRRRTLMARVMVTRHLRRLTQVGGGTRICADPITTDIYWLFLRDTGNAPPDDPTPFKPGAPGPVVGVRAGDLPAFVQWVNEIVGGEPPYRLPTRAEITDPAVRRGLGGLCVWLEPADLWTPAGHPHAVSAETLVRHVLDDLSTPDPTLVRLLLVRSLVLLRAISFDLIHHAVPGARARTLVNELVQGLVRAGDLAFAGVADEDLVHTLDPVLAHVFDLARAIDREVDHARALELARLRDLARVRAVHHALALELALGRAFNAARARDREHDTEWSTELVHDLDRALDRDFEYARELAAVLDTDLEHALDVDAELELDTLLALDLAPETERTPVPARELDRHLTAAVGGAMSVALADALRESESMETGDWRCFQAAFAGAFVATTGIEGTDRIVSPDTLADDVRNSCAALDAETGWPGEVAKRLEKLAVPVFERRTPATTDSATAIRIGALCLAREAETRGRSGVADALRRVAAGVTLLERRESGESPAVEAIVLATA